MHFFSPDISGMIHIVHSYILVSSLIVSTIMLHASLLNVKTFHPLVLTTTLFLILSSFLFPLHSEIPMCDQSSFSFSSILVRKLVSLWHKLVVHYLLLCHSISLSEAASNCGNIDNNESKI